MINKLFHPELFQGNLRNKKYFEGWYYKLVSADEQHVVAVIPGISIFDAKDRHAFIQVFNGKTHETNYHRFPLDHFKTNEGNGMISIGDNHFSKDGIQLTLPELSGEIRFHDLISPASSLLRPGVMGWFSYVPFMQCRHEVVSLHHQLDGRTSGAFGGMNWQGGIGYTEKDRGNSFPLCWIWMHSNHFHDGAPVSLMASVAHIPWMGKFFPGFIVVLFIRGKEYRFATYNHSQMKCNIDEDTVMLAFKRKDLQLFLTAHRGETASLHMPVNGQMTGKMNESLKAKIDVELRQHNEIVWKGTGTTAGLDVSGDTTILESGHWRK